MWLSLIVKAFAKINGGYDKLNSSSDICEKIKETLMMLTGCPTYSYTINDDSFA
jgi:hypothetical protein